MPKPDVPQVKCPACGRKQPRRSDDAIYFCENCRGQFDNESEEGGDYSDRNPAARLERQERAAQKKRAGRPRTDRH